MTLTAHRLACGMEDTQDSQSILPVRLGCGSIANTVEEMGALNMKRLIVAQLYDFTLSSACNRLAIHPLDPMLIENQFLVSFRVVKNRHLAIADNHEFLLLKRMQPAHKNVSLDTALEAQDCQGHIGNRMVQIAGPLRRYGSGRLTQKMENRSDIMGSEAPKNIFLCAEFAEIQSGGADVFHAAQFAKVQQAAQFNDRRVILKQVTNHQNA